MTIPPNPPTTFDQLYQNFGDIRKYINEDGTLDPSWEEEKIIRLTIPQPTPYAFDAGLTITKITVHTLIADIAQQMYAEIWAKGLWPALGPYGGGFAYRPNRNNSAVLSLHSWGLAWDWSPVEFPNGSPKERDPLLTQIAQKYHFRWGQVFRHPDPMHVSYSSGAIG